MRKLIIILCLILLSSCSKNENPSDVFDVLALSQDFNNNQAMYNGERGFYSIESGLFFLDDSILRFYSFDTSDVLELSTLSYCDDEPIEENEPCDAKNYSERIDSFSIIQVYDGHIYYEVNRYDIKNGFSFTLNKVDLIGGNKESVFTFEDNIYNYLLHRDKLVYLRSDNSSITIVDLDSEQNDLYFEYPLGSISRITAQDDYIYFVAIDYSKTDFNENIYSYNINTQKLNLEASVSNIDYPLITDEFI